MTQTQKTGKPAKVKTKRPSLLNHFFHQSDLGSNLGREIAAGILLCFLGVCGIFMNMQLVCRYIYDFTAMDAAAMGEAYASYYFLAMVLAFAGTLLMGIFARLPLVQISGLGISTVLITTLGVGSGLSYANLLAVCFVSSLLYIVLFGIPALRKAILGAIPESVRRALPAAFGVLLAFVALQLTGLVSFNASPLTVTGTGTVLNLSKIQKVNPQVQIAGNVQLGSLFDFAAYNGAAYKGDSYFPLIQVCLIAVMVTFIAYALLRKTKHPMLYSLLIGTLGYFVGYLCTVVFYFTKNGALQFELDSLWARLWMVGSEDAMHLHLPTIFANLSVGKLLTEGFDFTAFTENGGNVTLLFLTGIFTNLALMAGNTDAVLLACDASDATDEGRAHLCGGIINAVSPLFGQTGMCVSPVSVSAARDGAKSGIAAVVAAIFYAVSAFVWIVPFLFATTTSYDIQFNQYGHYGVVLAMLTDNSFLVADAVMVLTGLYMAVTSLRGKLDFGDSAKVIPFVATVLFTIVLTNPVLGICAGILAHLFVSIFDRQRHLTLGNLLAALVSLGYIALTLVG